MAAKSSKTTARRERGAPPGPRPKPKLSALDAGIRLLARRPYGRVELGRRLLRLGYQEDEVTSALDDFVERRYLDDATFADLHVARRAGNHGPRALAAELTTRGVDRATVRAAVSRFDHDAQVEMAVRLVRRDIGSKLPATYEGLLKKQGGRLLRRGYSPSVASAACRVAWNGLDPLAGAEPRRPDPGAGA